MEYYGGDRLTQAHSASLTACSAQKLSNQPAAPPTCTVNEYPYIHGYILWRVFRILMEPVRYTFVTANRRNIEARGPTLHATKYTWISVFDLSGGWGEFNPPLVVVDPHTGH